MYTRARKIAKDCQDKQRRGQFWIRNITRTHVTLHDLNDSIPPLQTVDLLARNSFVTMEMITNSTVLRDLLSRNILVRVQGPQQIVQQPHIQVSRKTIERPKRSSITAESLPFEKELMQENSNSLGAAIASSIDDSLVSGMGTLPATMPGGAKISSVAPEQSVNVVAADPTKISSSGNTSIPSSISAVDEISIDRRNKVFRKDRKLCEGVNIFGKRCELYPQKGSRLCHHHNKQIVLKDTK